MSDADDGKSDQDTGASSPPATDAPVVSIQDLRENDSELWLVRVPQHETIRSALIGKEIAVGDGHQRTSVEKSYNIVDMGRTTACSELRALFPTSSTNYAGFSCGPAFSRQLDVRFEPEIVAVSADNKERSYPSDGRVIDRWVGFPLSKGPGIQKSTSRVANARNRPKPSSAPSRAKSRVAVQEHETVGPSKSIKKKKDSGKRKSARQT